MNPIAILASIVGGRAARPVFLAIIALLALGLFGLAKCVSDKNDADAVQDQAEQTTRSSDAMADAAQNAVAVIVNEAKYDKTVDQVVTEAAREIDAAPTSSDARKAALRAVCGLPEYRGDPACE